MLPPEAPQHVKDELQSNETITWIGQPSNKLALKATAVVLVAALLFIIFFLKDFMGFGRGANFFLAFQGIGLVFTAFGMIFCFMVLSAPVRVWLYFKRTYYVVTDKRYIVISGGNKNRKVQQYDKKTVTPLMSASFLGVTNLVWRAPGFYKDSDGDSRQNTLTFAGIEPREVFNITSETFPKLSEAVKTTSPPR
ncbi:hypothetical protein KA183_14325 [bacterium]|nr:hypothetical protein [bacterium]